MEGKRIVVSYEWGTDLESLIKALEKVQQYVVDVPDYVINVDIHPDTNEPNVAGRVRVIEETLTDNSLVYNVELFG
jgi:hypothetical protein